MTKRRSKPSEGVEFVAGFKETANWADPKPRQGEMELPLPDYAPFAVPSDEVWRELQRRRNLVRMVETLAQSARDEGFPLSSQILGETAAKLKAALITVEMTRQSPKTKQPSRKKQSLPDELPRNCITTAASQPNGAKAPRRHLPSKPSASPAAASHVLPNPEDALLALEHLAVARRGRAKK